VSGVSIGYEWDFTLAAAENTAYVMRSLYLAVHGGKFWRHPYLISYLIQAIIIGWKSYRLSAYLV